MTWSASGGMERSSVRLKSSIMNTATGSLHVFVNFQADLVERNRKN